MEQQCFTEYEIYELEHNLRVQTVCKRTFTLTEESFLELRDLWSRGKDKDVIENQLEEWGFTKAHLGNRYIGAVIWGLRRSGMAYPGSGQIRKLISEIALLSSGVFHEEGGTVRWCTEIKESIAEAYPETSVEKSVSALGLTREILGGSRMSSLRNYCRKRNGEKAIAEKHKLTAPEDIGHKENGIEAYWRNPYVKSVSGTKTLIMRDTFYNETYLLDAMQVEELLGIYEIDAAMLGGACLGYIRRELEEWTRTEAVQEINNIQLIRIQTRRLRKFEELSLRRFDEIRASLKTLSPGQKKIICKQLSCYPTSRDYLYGYSQQEILKKVGISKTTYYKALNSSSYGMAEEIRRERDKRDLASAMKVVSYKGFEKGIRQIYMMMPEITGEQFAMSKIRRLLRNAGIKTKVRGENPARQRTREFHERNTKPNLLKREFRLHRPNEVRLTDVTYLDYGRSNEGGRCRAYGSSCIDPVTGKLLAFNVSENNDVELAMETLAKLSEYPTMIGALFHSDQGILYLIDEFQAMVTEMGMVQSMSKRGNCWDNAPQESFFGHFKDECRYEECETFEQLKVKIDEYAYYYNNERHQWSRLRMTPVEYEAYMEAMTDEEFAAYMETERAKYVSMREKAEKQARERAKTLGV